MFIALYHKVGLFKLTFGLSDKNNGFKAYDHFNC